jgi:hypothetical protein
MELLFNTRVYFADGPSGRITHIVLDAGCQKVTHLVMSVKDRYPCEYLMPIGWVVGAALDSIQLCCTGDYLDLLAPFSEIEWQKSDPFCSAALLDEFLLHRLPVRPIFIAVKRKRISTHELALRRGNCVRAIDGRAGRLEGLVIDPVDGGITHLIMRMGLVWNARKALIAVHQIDCIENETIFVKLAKRDLVGVPFTSVGGKKLRVTT